jgi:hypothetical protein
VELVKKDNLIVNMPTGDSRPKFSPQILGWVLNGFYQNSEIRHSCFHKRDLKRSPTGGVFGIDLTVLALTTGTGKTLIAILAMDFFRGTCPDKTVLFMAPTQALADQQAEFCRTFSSTQPSVAVLYGRKMDDWNGERCGPRGNT